MSSFVKVYDESSQIQFLDYETKQNFLLLYLAQQRSHFYREINDSGYDRDKYENVHFYLGIIGIS